MGRKNETGSLGMAGDLGEMLWWGISYDVPASCIVFVTTLWTNPRPFFCIISKYVRVLRFSAYSYVVLHFPKN